MNELELNENQLLTKLQLKCLQLEFKLLQQQRAALQCYSFNLFSSN